MGGSTHRKPEACSLGDSPLSGVDWDRGKPHGSSPPTPPDMRVRIRRFEKLRCCSSWAFGVMGRQLRFSLFPSRSAGFTRSHGREVQFSLDIPLPVALEIHVVLATPLVRAFSYRFRLGLSVDSAFRHWSASLALPTS